MTQARRTDWASPPAIDLTNTLNSKHKENKHEGQ